MNASNHPAAPARRTQRIYRWLLPHFRQRRMQLFAKLVGVTETTRVLDVGGNELNWQWCHPRPEVTIVNLASGHVRADGRRLPFRDSSFDVVFSNSVIEHVGDSRDQEAFAAEVARVGRRYFVQTPNRNFPIEPHFLAPCVQFLPLRLRPVVVRYVTPWGLLNRPTRDAAVAFVRSIRLLTPRTFRGLFPTAQIHRERFLGVTKSLLAVRSWVAA